MHSRLVCIGLGGICEGYLYQVLLLQQTKILDFPQILLVDGKSFRSSNTSRQHFKDQRNKAIERCNTWRKVYPDAPLRHRAEYIHSGNIQEIIPEGALVLLAPDNYATRKLVSDYMGKLSSGILICGGNNEIDPETNQYGTIGAVVVHCKLNGQNLTPPLTKHHEAVANPKDKLPTDVGCIEQAQAGQPQLLATNLMVGSVMAELLYRYCTMPPKEAVQIVEVWVDSRTGEKGLFGLRDRPL